MTRFQPDAHRGHGTEPAHPLARTITDALDGRPPACDGGWHRVAPWLPQVEAVLAFTGHAVLAVGTEVVDAHLSELGVDGFGGAHHPRVLLDLAGPHGWIDSLDALLARRAAPGPALVPRPELGGHPRVDFARKLRSEVEVYGRPHAASGSVATVSRGIAGLCEISVELADEERGQGAGAAFIRAAVATRGAGELVVAAVAPGNVASLRAFLRAGFVPVASVQLLRPMRDNCRDRD